MLRMIRLTLVSLLFCSTIYLAAQTKLISGGTKSTEYCTDYHKKNARFKSNELKFTLSSQSRSALFRPGQKSSFVVTAYSGYDYRFTFAVDEKLVGANSINYRIIDAKSQKELYNSAADKSEEEFMFTCTSSLNLKIELEIPEIEKKGEINKAIYGCVGFLLESRKTIKTGF